MSSSAQLGHNGSSFHKTVLGRLAQLRHMQNDLSTRPVTGSMPALKKPFYKLVRSAFSRQLSLNAATVDLIESIYHELGRKQTASAVAEVPELQTGESVASYGGVQDQNQINNIRPLHGFSSVYTSPAEMRMPERVALYSLVFGIQPRNCLEIGTFRGGSTAIICGAMDDTGFGQIACVDPTPRIDAELWSAIGHRCRMFEGPSPQILSEVAEAVGAPFDFALIDGNHEYEYLLADIAGTLPLMADNSHILFHDAHSPGVKRAIDESLAKYRTLTDCGLLSVESTVIATNGNEETWAGLRLLRFQRAR